MSHLPPPPPNAAPYAPPPPPQYGVQPYPYPPPGGYQQAPPPPANYQNGYHQSQSSPLRSHQTTGHDRLQKSKMVVTRYARPPQQQHTYSSQPHAGSFPPPPPVAAIAAPYQPPAWNQSPPHGPPAPLNYPPPPNYPQPPPTGIPYPPPPPPQPASLYPGYGPQPPSSYPPPPARAFPPPHPQPAAASGPGYAPPPPLAQNASWNAPPQLYPPQPQWPPSPAPASHRPPAASTTPAPSVTNVLHPQSTPAPEVVIKDLGDPTLYDGWDDGEFEYGMALWIPQKGDTSHDQWSLGQYIWRPPAQVTHAIQPNVDDTVPLASIQQKYDPAHFVISSKYFDTEDAEGHEYVYNFQRIRYVDAWKERKDDPLFKAFTDGELHEDVLPADEVFEQVLTRPKEDNQAVIEADIKANVTDYLSGTKGGTGKNVEKENVLASLGVSGTAKPVFATPFPAYNPPTEEAAQPEPRQAASRSKHKSATPTPQRGGFNPFKASSNISRHATPHSNNISQQPSPPAMPTPPRPAPHSQRHSYSGSPSTLSPDYRQPTPPQVAQYPPPPPAGYSQSHPAPPPQHMPSSGYDPQNNRPRSHISPSYDYKRSPAISPWDDDSWKVSNGHRDGTPGAPGTPAGSDFGDFPANGKGTGSAQHTPVDSLDHRKRKMDEPDPQQRKRTKAQPRVDPVYRRRW